MNENEVTIKVLRGTKVNIQEVDQLTDDDPRMREDREVHMIVPSQLKIAINRVTDSPSGATANVESANRFSSTICTA